MSVLDPATGLSLRVAAALVFGAAAWGKWRDPARFTDTLRAYRLLPRRTVSAVARTLPVVEALLALYLLAALPWAAGLAAFLLMLFAGGMAVNLVRGRADIACGCSFGVSSGDRLRWAFVARNMVGAAALLACPREMPPAAQAMGGLLGGVALFLVLEAANALWALPARLRPEQAA